ncbi:hypothetical protein ACFE04_005765 [Oxalis oulophora]
MRTLLLLRIGFPVIMGILKEERYDVEMVRRALETLVGALSPIEHVKVPKNEIQPALMNTDLLSREPDSVSLLLIRGGFLCKILYSSNFDSPSYEFTKQDCLELLNNLLGNNTSNQNLLREMIGLDPIVSILKGRAKIGKQKTINLLSALKTIKLLIMGGSESEPAKDANRVTNKTVLVQNKALDYLLVLGVETPWAAVDLRCMALWCVSDLISGHPKNRDALGNKVLGEEPQLEPALNSILRIALRTSVLEEFLAADNIFKSFCEKNTDGQIMLASTLIPQPHSMTHATFEEDIGMSFGSLLLRDLTSSERDGYLETCCRAASVLSHILKDNIQCKERVLKIELEGPTKSLGSAELLLHQMMKYLALASSIKNEDSYLYIQPIILKLLVTWLVNCPIAVSRFLDSRANLTYLLELVSNPSATACTRGLAAILLGECVVYNKTNDNGKDPFSVVDAISQKVGLTSYYQKFDDMQKGSVFSSTKSANRHEPFSRSPGGSLDEIDDVDENDATDQKYEDHLVLASIFDAQFFTVVKTLEAEIRENVTKVYSRPKNEVAVVPAEMEQKKGESDKDYVKRLKAFIEKQCLEIQELLGRNAVLAEDLSKIGGTGQPELRASTGSERVHAETLRRDLLEASQRLEILRTEKADIESAASTYRNLSEKLESDLKSLSDAYNSLEQLNLNLEKEIHTLKSCGADASPDVEAIKSEAREEALKESETELSDLLVCLGQEQNRVEKLSARLLELGVDVDALLEGVGDDVGPPEDEEEEE